MCPREAGRRFLSGKVLEWEEKDSPAEVARSSGKSLLPGTLWRRKKKRALVLLSHLQVPKLRHSAWPVRSLDGQGIESVESVSVRAREAAGAWLLARPVVLVVLACVMRCWRSSLTRPDLGFNLGVGRVRRRKRGISGSAPLCGFGEPLGASEQPCPRCIRRGGSVDHETIRYRRVYLTERGNKHLTCLKCG